MYKLFRAIGMLAFVVVAFGGCIDEQPPAEADLGDTNQPLMEDMGEVSYGICDFDADEDCYEVIEMQPQLNEESW